MWFNLSAAQGYTKATRGRDTIAQKLTNQQLAEAQKLARDCSEKKYKDCGS